MNQQKTDAPRQTRDRGAIAFYILAAIGVVVCVLTELEKYLPAVEQLCGGAGGGCATVRESRFSSLFGIPLGYWGIAAYIAWAGLFRLARPWAGMFGAVLLGAELYFVYLQFYVIKAICILCMTQFAVVLILNLLLFAIAYPQKGRARWRLAAVPLMALAFLAFYLPLKAQARDEAASATSITSWGDPKSEYRIEIFTDYQCSHCKHYEPVVQKIMRDYPQTYIIFHDYIIPTNALSPMAVAYAGSVAYYQGREMYIKTRFELFEKQDDLFETLKEKLPSMKKDKVMEAAVNEKIRLDRERADALGIKGTPTTVLVKNGEAVKTIGGVYPYEKVKEEIDRFLGLPVR
ncbi:MAG: thioredoxin domain-containing protein [Nitrospinae bacterium]|nr:thioredoxin domain-containing protein [Nitrospinota bacterium]